MWSNMEREAIQLLTSIDKKLNSFLNQQQIQETKVMSALTDLQAAVTQLDTDVATLIANGNSGAGAGGIAAADAEAIVAQIQQLDQQVQAAIAAPAAPAA